MPGGDGQNMFWSFNIGSAHIINFNTEAYYNKVPVYPEYGSVSQIITQYHWLEKDLEVKYPGNRDIIDKDLIFLFFSTLEIIFNLLLDV